jgi:hypothetical protein
VTVLTEFMAEQGGEVDDNAIITGISIIVKVDNWFAGASGDVGA